MPALAWEGGTMWARRRAPLIALTAAVGLTVWLAVLVVPGHRPDRPRTVADLVAALNAERRSQDRQEAARCLGALGGAEAVEALAAALADDDASVRAAAAKALAQLGEPAVPALLRVLTRPSADAREAALVALADIRDSRARTAVAQVLRRDRYSAVRAQAARAIGALKGESTVQALAAALEDPDPSVRLAVVQSLAGCSSPPAVRALQRARQDAEEAVRRAAEEALARTPAAAKPGPAAERPSGQQRE